MSARRAAAVARARVGGWGQALVRLGAPRPWDLPALLSAADPRASRAERNLWLVRLVEWLRHAPTRADSAAVDVDALKQPLPVLRLRHALNVLERNEEPRRRVALLLARFWAEGDTAALLADLGFSPRVDLFGELGERLRLRLLPRTPDTADLGHLFGLFFPGAADAQWLLAIDETTLARLTALVHDGWAIWNASGDAPATAAVPAAAPTAVAGARRAEPARLAWQQPFLAALGFLASAVRAAGLSSALRRRMNPELLVGQPFRQLDRAAERVREHAEAGETEALLREALYLRALLEACRQAATSVAEHLEEHGVSVDLVFQVDQLVQRLARLDELLTCLLAPEPAPEVTRLFATLVLAGQQSRSVRSLLSSHYSLLARKVAERSAERGEHYITRDRAEWRAMLRAAAGGGSVLAATTLLKFVLLGLGLSAFWGGLAAGINYATSFVLIQLLHFTVATKQPAMTAPTMAAKLAGASAELAAAEAIAARQARGTRQPPLVVAPPQAPAPALDAPRGGTGTDDAAVAAGVAASSHDAGLQGFVDEVAHLFRSQIAGILGNLALVIPLVLAAQYAWRAVFGAPIVGPREAEHVLHSLTLLGPTPLYAAFTGVLLFTSSLIAGWVENWFVWHRLDSALAWNPRIVSRLGSARAQRWAAWWRANVSALASNISLGLMLGLIPPVAAFFALPLDVRHVTLSTGQLAAALAAEGPGLLARAEFWWCAAGIAATGALNLGVSFFLAFKVALRSRGIRTAARSRIYHAIRSRLLRRPASFLVPPAG